MTQRYKKALHLLLLISILEVFSAIASASDVPKISKEELNAILNNPDLIVIDVRRERDWKSSSMKIKGAVWEDFLEVETWAQKYPKNKTIALYCD